SRLLRTPSSTPLKVSRDLRAKIPGDAPPSFYARPLLGDVLVRLGHPPRSGPPQP
ncbi:hypothetical protein NDU88_003981, partial [Pleurodeles waltl]